MKLNDIIIRIDQIIELGNKVLKTTHKVKGRHELIIDRVDTNSMISFRSASLNLIKTIYDENNPYYIEFNNHTNGHFPSGANNGISILETIKQEIEGGWLISLKDLASAEIFSDFLEMSEYLIEQKYKDAATVMIGSVLEEKLRQLAIKNIDIEVIKDGKTKHVKADKLNADLAKINIITKLDQKQITAWLDLRNKAAHGKYNEYNIEQVKSMLDGVLEFVSRIS